MAFDLHIRVFGLHVHSCTPQPPSPHPHIWAHIRGRYWSAMIDDITLCDPLDIAHVGVFVLGMQIITVFSRKPPAKSLFLFCLSCSGMVGK